MLKRGFVEFESDEEVIETAMVEPAVEARPKRRGRRPGAKVVGGRVVYPST